MASQNKLLSVVVGFSQKTCIILSRCFGKIG